MKIELGNVLEKVIIVAAVGTAASGVINAVDGVNPHSQAVIAENSGDSLPNSLNLGLESLALAATANLVKRRKLLGQILNS